MIDLRADVLFGPISHISSSIGRWRVLQQLDGHIVPPSMSVDMKAGFLHSVECIKETCIDLEMKTTVGVIERGYQTCFDLLEMNKNFRAREFEELCSFGEKILEVFVTEGGSRKFVALSPKHAEFLSPSTPIFGDAVAIAFPAIIEELADAGRCRAAGLWTASVMHLMRASEGPLGELAKYVGVEIQQNWNGSLNQIEGKLKERNRTKFGESEEQWASEAAAHFRVIKNAWRNHAQHGKVRYGEAELMSIWSNLQSLMQSLAKRLPDTHKI